MGYPAASKGNPLQGDAIYQRVKQEFGTQPCPAISQSPATRSHDQSDADGSSSDRPPKAVRRLLRTIRKHDEQSTRFVDALQQLEQEILSDQQQETPIMDRLKSMEEELLAKGTAVDKTAAIMNRLRKNIMTALVLRLAQVVVDTKELREVSSILWPAAREAWSAKRQETVNFGNRKRALSVNTATLSDGQPIKIRKVDHKPAKERMYATASGGWIFTSAKIPPSIGRKFEYNTFMQIRRKPKIRRWAKKYFSSGRQLFEYHAWQACRTAQSVTLKVTWQSLDEGHRAGWQDLLSKLHDGQRTALGDVGRSLLRKQIDLHRAARNRVASKEASSKNQGKVVGSRKSTQEESDSAKCQSDSPPARPQHTHTEHEAAQKDGLARRILWSDAEKRILLKGIHHGWSNEKIMAELPSIRRRTLKAVASAKAAIKQRYPNGLPVIRADTPFPFTPPATPPTQGAGSCASPGTITFEDMQQHAQSSPVNQRLSSMPTLCKLATSAYSARNMVAQPIFVLFPTRPPITPETKDMEYFLLPVDTPECPVSDVTEAEVSKACLTAFGGSTGFHSAQKLQGVVWVAAFQRPRILSGPTPIKFRVLSTTIHFRGHQFPPRYLSIRPPRTFIASTTDEPDLVTENLVTATKAAYFGRVMMPKLALQAMSRPDMCPVRRILAQFPQTPGLAQFYIPVLIGSSRRCVHVRFEPLDLSVPCWLCRDLHPDGWCNKATELQYSD